MNKLTDFAIGTIAGLMMAVMVLGFLALLRFCHNRDKELLEYAEKQRAIEILQEDYSNRDPYEFLDGVPGVRGAVDGATAEFERRREEAVYRFRNRLAD